MDEKMMRMCARTLAVSLAAAIPFAASGEVQTGAKMTFSGGSFIVKDVNGTETTFAAGESLCPTSQPAVYYIKPVLAAGTHLYAIYGADKLHSERCYRFPLADGWVPFAPFASAESNMTVTAVAAEGVLYVDENGNDDWDGLAAVHEEGTSHGPKLSLQAAHDAAGDNWLVYVAPGTYSNGVTTVSKEKDGVSYSCRRRLRITKPVGFRSTGGAENTFIVGAPDPDSAPDAPDSPFVQGCGDNAIGGVWAGNPNVTIAYLQGFTITGCYGPSRAQSAYYINYGAAFSAGMSRAGLVDCVVSNNHAYVGATACYGNHYRCRFFENESYQGTTGDYGHFHSCLFAANRLNYSDSDATASAFARNSTFYNCTIDLRSPVNPNGRRRLASSPSKGGMYGCIVLGYRGGSDSGYYGADSLVSGDMLFADPDARDYRLASLSPAVGRVAYDALPDSVRRGDGVDLNGNPTFVRNGMATIGAVHAPFLPSVAVVGLGGETVSGSYGYGTNIVTAAGGEVTVTALDTRPFLGFEVNGEMVVPQEGGRTYSFSPSAEAGGATMVKAVYDTNWYVDCVNGNDEYPGTEAWPKQTIRAATTNAVSGDVVHVAPGTYGDLEGSQKATADSKIGTRVVIPQGVTVESTAGAEKTFIVGADATGDQIDLAAYKTGTNAVRCVYANNSATIRGFTLTGGRGIGVDKDGVNGQGAAFYSASARVCYLEDCIVSNNIAANSTIHAAVVRRCRIINNWGVIHGSSDTPNSAPAGESCSWYSCVFANNRGNALLYQAYTIENCTIGPGHQYVWTSGTPQVLYWSNITSDKSIVNSAVLNGRFYLTTKSGLEKKHLYITNCIFRAATGDPGGVLHEEYAHNTRFSVPASESTLDADYRPVLGSYIGIDAGDASANRGTYDKDAFGNPRILNGAIDIGAVEYDWRPKFAQELGRSFRMTYASPTVTTNETGGVLIPAACGTLGDRAVPRCVAVAPTATGKYELRFRLDGGSAEVYVGGVLAEEASGAGEHSVRLNVADVADEIRFVFTPDVEDAGSALLRALCRANGFSVTIR